MRINQKEVNKDTLLLFLQRTREGKYTEIDGESLKNVRVIEQTEDDYSDVDYYYSIR